MDADELAGGPAGSPLCQELRLGPQKGRLDTQVLSGSEAVPWMGQTTAEPTADSLRIYFAGFGE
ncbi:hypothetical protein [Dactylosporangium sp. NPDC051484]|uniref:hypothetical protein n=1 Tax=Dactylosporangium sp. NPDC051484 TaxID=3154942 RepID=UPI00344DA193